MSLHDLVIKCASSLLLINKTPLRIGITNHTLECQTSTETVFWLPFNPNP
jgi:hypothetical protein